LRRIRRSAPRRPSPAAPRRLRRCRANRSSRALAIEVAGKRSEPSSSYYRGRASAWTS
jgi:hypothetical protein